MPFTVDFTAWSTAGFPGAEIRESPALTTDRPCLIDSNEDGIHEIAKRIGYSSKQVAEWALWTVREFEGLHEAKPTTSDELWLLCKPGVSNYFEPVRCPGGERIAILCVPPQSRLGKRGRPRKGEPTWAFGLVEAVPADDASIGIPDWMRPRRV